MKSICFTGHRKISHDIQNLKAALSDSLEKYITDKGITDFYCGGAVGFDMLAEQTVSELREKYPEIKLHLVLPCPYEDQTAKWDERQKEDFSKIMNAADTIEYTSDTHYKGCMKKRNEKLVEYADCCFCYWDGRYISGTAQTVRLAEKKGIPIINIFKK